MRTRLARALHALARRIDTTPRPNTVEITYRMPRLDAATTAAIATFTAKQRDAMRYSGR
jgi:hypothetical protein